MPTVAELIQEVVSEKLDRPALLRKGKNRNDSYITDPVFSYIQTADRNRRTDYRIGFRWVPQYRCLWFSFVYNPIGADTFQRNLDVTRLITTIRKTAHFRTTHNLYFSSKSEFSLRNHETKIFYDKDLNTFLAEVNAFDEARDLRRDLFPKLPNRGKSQTTDHAWAAGKEFALLLATGERTVFDKPTIKKIIALSWPLFLSLYPTKPIAKRDATLRRQLLVIDPDICCNMNAIRRLPKSIKNVPCSQVFEAAHIKPHRSGGTDKGVNGIWLCRTHHKLTEGKLKGNWPRPEYVK
ncbi:MAG TPA: HNH endonuclease signature motif containing protein [Flavobacteriales bacterium]|nr:HNH endonuclease signature motif containing protein [Flavobacteriales bacterium]